jgi:hypothetical protein
VRTSNPTKEEEHFKEKQGKNGKELDEIGHMWIE